MLVRNILFSFLALLFILFPAVAAERDNESTTVRVWSYYLSPPFYVSENEGLAHDFVELLNKELSGQYTFKLEIVPRARLNHYLNKNVSGIVLFVSDLWMESRARCEHCWTPALFEERNEVVSSDLLKLEYEQPESLVGRTFGSVRGREHRVIQPLIDKQKIKLFEVDRVEQIFQLMIKNRIDVTSLPTSIARAVGRKLHISDRFHYSTKPLYSFTRHVFITPGQERLHKDLSEIISQMQGNPNWQTLVTRYQLNQ